MSLIPKKYYWRVGGSGSYGEAFDVVQWNVPGDHPDVAVPCPADIAQSHIDAHGAVISRGSLGLLTHSWNGPAVVRAGDYIATDKHGEHRVLSRHELLTNYATDTKVPT
ncbi:MAG: hypothetical protein QOI88_3361 [Gammaproteobacteria bacterium]|jgi:hypothetical protein|nr:hypothetical protein [Gammaproteobacteria bacterium]